ncbi:MAG: ATP-binding domain-containing protein [Heteroscytonema crispum UTEX LB 1556]
MNIHRAKGNEADMVYVVGLDKIAKNESNIMLRNQLFVALTRSRAWVQVSGVGNYPMYDEFNQVITTCSQVNEYTNKDGEIQKVTTLTLCQLALILKNAEAL